MADYRGKAKFSGSEHRDAFARLFAQRDRWLFAYLVSLLGTPLMLEKFAKTFASCYDGIVLRIAPE